MIHFNTIFTFMPRSCKWPLFKIFPGTTAHNTVCIFLLPIHATCPAHLIPIDMMNLVIFCEQLWSRSSHCAVFSIACYFSPLRPKYVPQPSILEQPQQVFLCWCKTQRFTPTCKKERLWVCVFYPVCAWMSDRKTKDSGPNGSRHCLNFICS